MGHYFQDTQYQISSSPTVTCRLCTATPPGGKLAFAQKPHFNNKLPVNWRKKVWGTVGGGGKCWIADLDSTI